MSPFLADLREKVGSSLMVLPSVTGCVFDEQGRLLLAYHADIKRWATPGGGVDPDERPLDSVVRELREEIGVEVEVQGLIGVYGGPEFRTTYPNGHECAYVIATYGCTVVDGTPTPDDDEILEVRFVTEQQAAELPLTAWAPHVLPDVFAWWRDTRQFRA